MPPRSLHHRLSEEDGFTIVEVLVAAFVLVVGLLGTLTLVDTANTTTFQTKAREQASSLQREIVENARSVDYDRLTPGSVSSAIQGRAPLADGDPSAGWSITRRGETYTVAVGTCIVDDARDGTGARDAGTFCDPSTLDKPASGCQAALDATPSATAPAKAPGAVDAATAAACGIDADLDGTIENLTAPGATTCAGATCDTLPADYKRVVSMVRWEQGEERRMNLMVTTIANPGMSAAPAITNLTADNGISITNPMVASAPFTATAAPTPSTVAWYVDGAQRGQATASGAAWTWTWTFGTATTTDGAQAADGELVDGTYIVGAKAFDRYGQYGNVRSQTITVNRRRPFAPRNLRAGRNGAVVDLAWSVNAEGDVQGYRVFRLAPDGGTPVQVCPLTVLNTCQDGDPPPRVDGPVSYVAVAVDFESPGVLRQGDQSNVAVAVDDNQRPNPPGGLTATLVDGNVKLTWTRPDPEDPDGESCDPAVPAGRQICYFNVYRDGELFADRYDRTSTGEQLEWTDSASGGVSHTYYVTSVDRHLAESAKAIAVSP